MKRPSKVTDQENDWRPLLSGGLENKDPRLGLPEALITSDKNMESKTRLPHILAMTAMDLTKTWVSGEAKTLEDLLDFRYGSGGFGDRFRINAPNLDGKAREEYVITATMAMLQDRLEEIMPTRMKEGSRK